MTKEERDDLEYFKSKCDMLEVRKSALTNENDLLRNEKNFIMGKIIEAREETREPSVNKMYDDGWFGCATVLLCRLKGKIRWSEA